MDLGEQLKYQRNLSKKSQQELADYLCISRQAISRWENNLSVPDLNTLIKICKLYDISLEAFTDDVGYSREDTKKIEVENLTIDNNNKKNIYKSMTPYIMILSVIITLIALLPGKIKVPIFFFSSLVIIFFISAFLIYYIIKNFIEKSN